MSDIVSPSVEPALSPLRLNRQSSGVQLAALILGTLFLAISSYIEVPMVPVPITMQTFAVTLIGALFGWRLGGLTITAWLVEGALGLPVLAGGAAGAHHFLGATGGYIFAFPVAGMVVGWLTERGWSGNRILLAFASMLIGNLLCLVIGTAWLAGLIGVEQAIIHGALPFIVGAILKSALAAAILMAMARSAERAVQG